MKAKDLTISALSSALACIVLIIGTIFSDLLDLLSVIIAPILTCVPLYKDSIKGSVLSAIVAGVLAFLITFNPINLVYISYFSFFGFYPIIKYCAMTKRWKKGIYYPICMVWFALAVVGIYYYFVAFVGVGFEMIIPVSPKAILFGLIVGSIPLFVMVDAYTFAMQRFLFATLKRIIK